MPDSDAILESFNDDLRAQLGALNQLYHPVYPGSPRRIAELEARIAELRAAIAERRKAMVVAAPAGAA